MDLTRPATYADGIRKKVQFELTLAHPFVLSSINVLFFPNLSLYLRGMMFKTISNLGKLVACLLGSLKDDENTKSNLIDRED
jgi:hypothetical protein